MNKQQIDLSPLLTAKDAAMLLKVISVGRSIRYAEPVLNQWMKSRQRLSTSQQ